MFKSGRSFWFAGRVTAAVAIVMLPQVAYACVHFLNGEPMSPLIARTYPFHDLSGWWPQFALMCIVSVIGAGIAVRAGKWKSHVVAFAAIIGLVNLMDTMGTCPMLFGRQLEFALEVATLVGVVNSLRLGVMWGSAQLRTRRIVSPDV
jgi:hypothetical protein